VSQCEAHLTVEAVLDSTYCFTTFRTWMFGTKTRAALNNLQE